MGKQFKGTKGDWEWHTIGGGNIDMECIKSKNGKTICVVYKKPFPQLEVEANAKLISSAPELMKFAMFIASHEKGSSPSVGYFETMIEKAQSILDDILE